MDIEKILKIYQTYTKKHLNEIEKIEEYFNLYEFSYKDALTLGNLIIKESENYSKNIVVKITDEKNNLIVFQHVMDGKSERNLGFADAKRNAVLQSGHSSIWSFIKYSLNGKSINEVFSNQKITYTAGAFPIKIRDEIAYTIAVSGLDNGNDFNVVINAFKKFINKEILGFSGEMI